MFFLKKHDILKKALPGVTKRLLLRFFHQKEVQRPDSIRKHVSVKNKKVEMLTTLQKSSKMNNFLLFFFQNDIKMIQKGSKK